MKAQLPEDPATGGETGNQPSHRQGSRERKEKKKKEKPTSM